MMPVAGVSVPAGATGTAANRASSSAILVLAWAIKAAESGIYQDKGLQAMLIKDAGVELKGLDRRLLSKAETLGLAESAQRIGEVVDIQRTPQQLFQEVRVEPLADLSRLETVLVLSSFVPLDTGSP